VPRKNKWESNVHCRITGNAADFCQFPKGLVLYGAPTEGEVNYNTINYKKIGDLFPDWSVTDGTRRQYTHSHSAVHDTAHFYKQDKQRK
jgi:hypothetical protein